MLLTLKLKLGNDSMLTYNDVSTAVRKSFDLYHNAIALGECPTIEDEGTVRDENGNTVGKWIVTEDESSDPIERMYDEAFSDEATTDDVEKGSC